MKKNKMDFTIFDTLLDGIERARDEIYREYTTEGNTNADLEYWTENLETLKKVTAKIYAEITITNK